MITLNQIASAPLRLLLFNQGSAPFACRHSDGWGCIMSSINCARWIDTETRIDCRKVVQLFAVALTSVALAACAQSSAVTNKSELLGTSRQALLEGNRNAPLETH